MHGTNVKKKTRIYRLLHILQCSFPLQPSDLSSRFTRI